MAMQLRMNEKHEMRNVRLAVTMLVAIPAWIQMLSQVEFHVHVKMVSMKMDLVFVRVELLAELLEMTPV